MRNQILISVALITILFFTGLLGYSADIKNDTIKNNLLIHHSDQIEELARQRKLDSLEKMELVRQLNSLKYTETRKHAELTRRLEEISRNDSLKEVVLRGKIDSLKMIMHGAPVIAFPSDTIFFIFTQIGAYTPDMRAKAISERIRKIGGSLDFQADSLKIRESLFSMDLWYHDEVIMGITDADAKWMNTRPDSLARYYRKAIIASVSRYHGETGSALLLKKIGMATGILILLTIVIALISKAFRWFAALMLSKGPNKIKGVRIQDYELLNTDREIRILIMAGRMIKWLLILVAIYISLPIVFGIFPWTKRLATLLLGYVVTPTKYVLTSVWNYLPNLFTILVIVIVFRYTLKGVRYIKKEIESEALKIPGFHADLAAPTYQIIRFLVFAFMIVVIFPFLPGSNSPVFQGVSVFLGVLITFGSSGSLSNLIAGVVITYMRSFKTGDRVKIGDVSGDVVEKSMLVTRIRTIKNEMISIPNSTVLGSHLTNYSSEAGGRGLILNTTVTIGYDAPWRQIHQLLISAALATPKIEKEPTPFVLQTSLDDFYVSYQLNAYTREANSQAMIYSQLHQNIQDKFNDAGMEIMSPHYRAERDGNTIAIPDEFREKNYQAPAFRIKEIKPDQE